VLQNQRYHFGVICRPTAALLLTAVAAFCGQSVRITGTIVDRASRQGVEGASVEREFATGSNVALARTSTSKSGAFQFESARSG